MVKEFKKVDFLLHAMQLISKEWENYYGAPISKKINTFKNIFKKVSKPDKAMQEFEEVFNSD